MVSGFRELSVKVRSLERELWNVEGNGNGKPRFGQSMDLGK